MKIYPYKLILLLAVASIAGASETIDEKKSDQFEEIYKDSSIWPDFVTPTEDIFSEAGERILVKGIRCTLVRLNPNGTVLLHDRNGNIPVNYQKTNLIESTLPKVDHEVGRIQTILGRRIFCPKVDEKKALLGSHLDGVERFIVAIVKPDSAQLEKLNDFFQRLKNEKQREILIFTETIGSDAYYDLMINHAPSLTSMIPRFNEGMKEYFFSKDDLGYNVLELDKNGKLMARHRSIDDFTATAERPSPQASGSIGL